MSKFINARALIKSQEDDTVLANTVILDQDAEEGMIWVRAEHFTIEVNTKVAILIITEDTIHECLCMTRKKDQDGTRQCFSIYKTMTYEERKDDRYRMNARGSMMIVEGTAELKKRSIDITVTDISASGIGVLMSDQLAINPNTLCEVYFSSNGWSMRAKCIVKNSFGPKLGCKLVRYERQFLNDEKTNIETELRHRIDRAMEEIIVCAYYVDCEQDTFKEVIAMDYLKYNIGNETSARKVVQIILGYSSEKDRERLAAFYDFSTVGTRLEGKRIISTFFNGNHLGVCQVSMIPVVRNDSGKVTGVLTMVQKLDEDAYKDMLKKDEEAEEAKESEENEKAKPESEQ